MQFGGASSEHAMLGHVVHLAMKTGIQPGLQAGFFCGKVDPGYTNLVKP